MKVRTKCCAAAPGDSAPRIAAPGIATTKVLAIRMSVSATTSTAFASSAATPEYLEGLKKRIAQRGLAVNMTSIRFKPDALLAKNIADLRKQIENTARLELKFMLTFGVDQPAHYENFYRLMADAAAQTEKRGIQLVLKPHGGGSGAAEASLRGLDKVAHAS